MAKMTPLQVAEIRKLTRRANRRIERATGGQETYLKGLVKRATGAEKFSAATKGLTYEQAAAKLKQLDKFLGTRSTTRAGWKAIKRESVKKANDTLEMYGYDLTDEELAEILEQIGDAGRENFYRAVNLVSAAKGDEDWEGTADQVADAINQKLDYQEALTLALEMREAGRNK